MPTWRQPGDWIAHLSQHHVILCFGIQNRGIFDAGRSLVRQNALLPEFNLYPLVTPLRPLPREPN